MRAHQDDAAIAEFLKTHGTTHCPTAYGEPSTAVTSASDRAAMRDYNNARDAQRREELNGDGQTAEERLQAERLRKRTAALAAIAAIRAAEPQIKPAGIAARLTADGVEQLADNPWSKHAVARLLGKQNRG